jgi:hypothetical protein
MRNKSENKAYREFRGATRSCTFKTASESETVNQFNRMLKNVILQNVNLEEQKVEET